MEAIWFEYRKTQEQTSRDFELQHVEVNPRSKLEEIWAWEDHAIKRFVGYIASLESPSASERVERQRADLA